MSIVLNGTTGITTPDVSVTAQSSDIVTSGNIEAVNATLSGGVYVGGTSAANYLDDYEEGTWTPAYVSAGGGSVTMSIQTGKYAKIGNTVFVSCRVSTASISSPVGNVTISGLPFTSLSGDVRYAFSFADARGWGVSLSLPTAIVETSTTVITLTKQATNSSFLGVNSTDLSGSDGGNLVSIAGFYTV